MKLFVPVLSLMILVVSCKTGPTSDKQYAGINGTNVFQLRLTRQRVRNIITTSAAKPKFILKWMIKSGQYQQDGCGCQL